jgi:hypothetical protein
VLDQCARHSCLDEAKWDDPQERTVSVWLTAKANELLTPLRDLYREIRLKAGPSTTIVVLGYPHLFPSDDETCSTLNPWDGERDVLNARTDLFLSKMAQAAAAEGVWFEDVRDEFLGHEICADDEWINGPQHPEDCGFQWPPCDAWVGGGSFHPTAEGHREGYSKALRNFLDSKIQAGSPLTPYGLPANPAPA